MRKFEIVLADAPWEYRDKANAGKRGAVHDCGEMSVDDVCAMPVADHVADNAVCFLWCTWPILLDCPSPIEIPGPLKVLWSWGFRPKTLGFDWVKMSEDGNPLMGGGHYTRSNSEVCIIGVRGKGLERKNAGVRQTLITHGRLPKMRKPSETRDRIAKLYGPRRRVELFARERVPGWSRWGIEAPRGVGYVPIKTFRPGTP